LVPRTYDSDCSPSHIGRPRLIDGPEANGGYWPTPRAIDNGAIKTNRADPHNAKSTPTLSEAVLLWPTPTVGDSKSAANRTAGRSDPDSGHHDGVTLTDAVRMWPTPVANDTGRSVEDYRAMRTNMAGGPRQTVTSLGVAARMWPTPQASDGTGGRVERLVGGERPSGSKRGVPLGTAVTHWPTPNARDGDGRSTPSTELAADRWEHGTRCLEDAVSLNGNPGGMLNPTWVEWLMGFPAGWTDLDASGTP